MNYKRRLSVAGSGPPLLWLGGSMSCSCWLRQSGNWDGSWPQPGWQRLFSSLLVQPAYSPIQPALGKSTAMFLGWIRFLKARDRLTVQVPQPIPTNINTSPLYKFPPLYSENDLLFKWWEISSFLWSQGFLSTFSTSLDSYSAGDQNRGILHTRETGSV